jgi:hypothetical protein
MLNKDQALAAMDAHIIRAEAEQRRRLEVRVHRITRLYPALRLVPLEERETVVADARAQVFRRWTLYATTAVVLAASVLLVVFRDRFTGAGSASALYGAVLLPAAGLNLSIYLHLRSAVKRVVAARELRGE